MKKLLLILSLSLIILILALVFTKSRNSKTYDSDYEMNTNQTIMESDSAEPEDEVDRELNELDKVLEQTNPDDFSEESLEGLE